MPFHSSPHTDAVQTYTPETFWRIFKEEICRRASSPKEAKLLCRWYMPSEKNKTVINHLCVRAVDTYGPGPFSKSQLEDQWRRAGGANPTSMHQHMDKRYRHHYGKNATAETPFVMWRGAYFMNGVVMQAWVTTICRLTSHA